jgi:hypothetical protein
VTTTFRASLTDGPRPIVRDTELAQRTAVAHFPGPNVRAGRDAFSGEADPKGLTVFHYGGGGGGIPTGAIGDRRSRGPMTAAKLQRQIVEHRLVRNDC